jgi:hypothetical protein
MRLTDSCCPATRFATVIVRTAIHARTGGQPADQDMSPLSLKLVRRTRSIIAKPPALTTTAM